MIDREMLQAVALFESGKPVLDYENVEDDDDGRGWTCGIAGFTLEEAKYFTGFFPVAAWHKPEFPTTWKNACRNFTTFKSFQEHLFMKLFGKPSESVFKARNFAQRTTLVALLDTVVQHGNGLDPDGFMEIVHRTDADFKAALRPQDEQTWILQFLQHRWMVLTKPKNQATRLVWRQSRSRVKVLKKWVENEKIDLQIEVP
jgi:chitosanase